MSELKHKSKRWHLIWLGIFLIVTSVLLYVYSSFAYNQYKISMELCDNYINGFAHDLRAHIYERCIHSTGLDAVTNTIIWLSLVVGILGVIIIIGFFKKR